MLYPKEDRLNNTLMFACRTCQFSEPAASSCVYRNNLSNTVGETAGVTQDVGSDPTVGTDLAAAIRVISLPSSYNNATCDGEGAMAESPDFFTCTLCGEEILCDFCGEESEEESLGNEPGEYEDDTRGVVEEEEEEQNWQ